MLNLHVSLPLQRGAGQGGHAGADTSRVSPSTLAQVPMWSQRGVSYSWLDSGSCLSVTMCLSRLGGDPRLVPGVTEE